MTEQQKNIVTMAYDVAVHTVMVNPRVLEDKRPNMASIVRHKIMK